MIRKQPNPLGQVWMFNGRDQMCVLADKAANSPNINIYEFMRQYLWISIRDDIFWGLDGSSALHLPTQNPLLVTFTHAFYGYATGSGLIGLNWGDNFIRETTSWGEWHEYGHEYETHLFWKNGLVDSVNNLNSLDCCRFFTGKDVPLNEDFFKKCHGSLVDVGITSWDLKAVPNFIKSGANKLRFGE